MLLYYPVLPLFAMIKRESMEPPLTNLVFACPFCQKESIHRRIFKEKQSDIPAHRQPFICVSSQVCLPHKDSKECCVAVSFFVHWNRCLYQARKWEHNDNKNDQKRYGAALKHLRVHSYTGPGHILAVHICASLQWTAPWRHVWEVHTALVYTTIKSYSIRPNVEHFIETSSSVVYSRRDFRHALLCLRVLVFACFRIASHGLASMCGEHVIHVMKS